MQLNQWRTLREVFNSHPLGTRISRKQMIYNVFGQDGIEKFKHELTIDHYRRYLTVLGYLKHVSRGLYQIKKRIPNDLTKRQLEHLYSEELWRNREKHGQRLF